jgi:hypothetical protein
MEWMEMVEGGGEKWGIIEIGQNCMHVHAFMMGRGWYAPGTKLSC